jgi:four helix bundle protein
MTQENGSQKLIAERTMDFSLLIIYFYRQIRNDEVGKVLGKQLLRSATSIGANVQEAQGAQSKADFISKISISYKEARESLYWIRLFDKAQIGGKETIKQLSDELFQILRMLASILLTSKEGRLKEEDEEYLAHSSLFTLNS